MTDHQTPVYNRAPRTIALVGVVERMSEVHSISMDDQSLQHASAA